MACGLHLRAVKCRPFAGERCVSLYTEVIAGVMLTRDGQREAFPQRDEICCRQSECWQRRKKQLEVHSICLVGRISSSQFAALAKFGEMGPRARDVCAHLIFPVASVKQEERTPVPVVEFCECGVRQL